MFNSSLVDHNLALGYCTLLPKEAVFQNLWDIINKTAQNYSKILVSLEPHILYWNIEDSNSIWSYTEIPSFVKESEPMQARL